MRKEIILLLVFILCISLIFISTDYNNIIKKADQLYEMDKFNELYTMLKKLYDQGIRDYEILWRLARATQETADQYKNKDQKIKKLEEAEIYAKEANKVKPENKYGHYWLAAIYGKIGEEKGPLNAAFLIDPMKNELIKALRYDRYFSDAYYVLGALYFKGIAVVNFFSTGFFRNVGISYIRYAIYLVETQNIPTVILSLYYHDMVEFLLTRKLKLKKKISLWKDFKKRYNRESDYIEKNKYFTGFLAEPTMDDIEEAKYYYNKLQLVKEKHKWDKEQKEDAYKLIKDYF